MSYPDIPGESMTTYNDVLDLIDHVMKKVEMKGLVIRKNSKYYALVWARDEIELLREKLAITRNEPARPLQGAGQPAAPLRNGLSPEAAAIIAQLQGQTPPQTPSPSEPSPPVEDPAS